MKPTVVIAGASGFIGRWFIEKYKDHYNIIALSRKIITHPVREQVQWRTVDLYSLSSTTEALKGADCAIYLVHSMQPSTRLNQGSFDDTDLLLADNFARAAEQCRLKQIVFIGGILPKDQNNFSRHLRSRYEVETTLNAYKTPLTSIRAGIIIGPGGSSFSIIEKLVRRLPVLICPKWTLSENQPIDVDDVLEILDAVIGMKEAYHQSIEIGGTEVVSYKELLARTAPLLGKRPLMFSFPFFTVGLSKFWVGLFSNSSRTFVSPLVESLKHTMLVEESSILKRIKRNYRTLDESIKKAIHEKDRIPKMPDGEYLQVERNTVRSVQRLPNPSDQTATWVAKEYGRWLPTLFRNMIRVDDQIELVRFRLLGLELLRLQFVNDRSDHNRQLYYIVGGLLVKRPDYGWLEFRTVLGGKWTITAIHNFVPRLPWFIYVNTQAIVHLWVMKKFGSYLSKSIDDSVNYQA